MANFSQENRNLSSDCLKKSNFLEICLENRFLCVKLQIFMEKSIFLPASTTPQISNQIDAAVAV